MENWTVEDLVPDKALCEEIPKGAFAGSAMVYRRSYFEAEWVIEPRAFAKPFCETIPAPTLAEIMAAIMEAGIEPVCMYRGNVWRAYCEFPQTEGAKQTPSYHVSVDLTNPATAMLKMWIAIRGVKSC